MRHFFRIVSILLFVISVPAHAGTLDRVRQRGALKCGVNGELSGFSVPDSNGNWAGFDVDFCRAIASAIFNDSYRVRFVSLSAKDRFTALQTGDVDVLVRDTTWTLSRDTQLGLNATGVTYYDGQGFMVRRAAKVNTALSLSGATLCVQQGTTTELNMVDYFRVHHMRLKSVAFATRDEAANAYESDRCTAFTTDISGLYSTRLKLVKPIDHMILPEVISKEPLGPYVRHGDDQWFDIVKWVHFAMLNAEEFDVTTGNVDQRTKSGSIEIRRMLGNSEDSFGESLGLSKDWVYRIVKLVGNYGEVFDRNLGLGSPLRIERGLNQLWTRGGLHYAPPIR
jgi:general L-amino acid transport system substrate-binding protein